MKTKSTVLLVEDDGMLSDLVSQKMASEGITVDYAQNGKTAIEKVHTNKHDVVILDLRLPDIDGLDVLKDIRENEDTKDLPVIVFSNFNEESYKEKAKELGANETILKVSLSLDEVVEFVRKYM